MSACRAALQQINVALGNRPATRRPPALDPKRRERLQKMFGLSDDEMNEVAAESYTLLDGWRLDEAFLLRDAATHVLEPEEEGGDLPALSPLERASAAFAWTVREVRLADPTDPGGVPPQFVLRRASGTALERSLVFLDLLEQLGVADEDGDRSAARARQPRPYMAVWSSATTSRTTRRGCGPAASWSATARTCTSSTRAWGCRCRARTARASPRFRPFARTPPCSNSSTPAPSTSTT